MSWKDNLPGNLKVPGSEVLGGALASVSEAGNIAVDKMLELVDEYGKAVAILAKYGFKVGKFSMSVQLPPEAKTSIQGSISGLPEADLKALAESHKDQRVIALLLNSLVLAKQVHSRVALGFDSITLHLTLALKPGIEWEFH